MNIFILNTGRCGSTTFIKACHHISNYTALHESRATLIGKERLNYPSNHIEADNRLSWFLGRLDRQYGDNAFYLYLSRDLHKTATSFAQRESYGIMQAYREGILLGGEDDQSAIDIAHDYIVTVESNIEHFLQDKNNKMNFNLESAKDDFRLFWERIGAEGDLDMALSEWDTNYNASEKPVDEASA
ncbi:MAG TPA: hypothetical protein ENH92_05330 [Ectothiorhodospiraceae bacterium]|nr:hypothetical protein [Ectothiorhodospiraceae bacterium]